MNKLIALCSFLFITGLTKVSTAQSNINKLSSTTSVNISSKSSDDISQKNLLLSDKKDITESDIEESNSIVEKLTALQFKYAMLLNVNIESLKNLSLFGLIDNWFGTKYRMGGTSKTGIDCSAFTGTLLSAIYGLILPRTALQQYHITTHVNKNDLKEGDLVFFHIHKGVSHVGLYLANNYFVHASTSQGVTISSLDDSYYSKRFICGGRAGVN